MTRITRTLAPLLALGLTLAACGSDSSGGNSSDTTAAAAEVKLVKEGNLTVCSDAPYEPFEYQDDQGNWTGFDMDIMSAIADKLGVALNVVVTPFDGIWLAPTAGTCDVVASSMTITEERKQNALFSDPYFDADQSLLVRNDDAATYTSLESLAGKTIAVQTGTTGESYAKENATDAKIQSFDDAAAMFLALDSKQVDAILQDLPINASRAIKQGTSKVTATFSTNEQYGFSVAPSNTALVGYINSSLAAFRTDGTYDTIFAKYFGDVK
jgi:polar amino acid transport system substrate-binding protein